MADATVHTRRAYPLLYWKDIKNIVISNRLEEMGRSDQQQSVYDDFQATIKQQYCSMRDFILITKFNYNTIQKEDKLAADAGMPSGHIKITLNRNDYPYNFEEGMEK